MEQPGISTERLILRPFRLSDARSVAKLAGNYNVAKSTTSIPHPYPEALAAEWIATHAHEWSSKSRAIFAITTKAARTLIGTVSLITIENSRAEIGYWIGEPYWGNGYCTEAVKALIEFSQAKLGIIKFTAEHLESNPASGKVLSRAGMRRTKTEQKPDRFGQKSNVECYEYQNS